VTFRFKAFALHFLGSATVLSIVLGTLYFGWYRWPGWYLTGVMSVSAVLAGVDVALGPLMTLVVANPAKPRRELRRDIGIIITVQVVALLYGAATLWSGRPLYYTFSIDRLEVVRSFELVPPGPATVPAAAASLAPHWYSLPRWIWVPMPEDPKLAIAIVNAATAGGADVIDLPQYFRPWADGLPELRKQLKTAEKLSNLSADQKIRVKARMQQLGFQPDQPMAMIMTGRNDPLIAIFDLRTLTIVALIRPE
jgi:hypothetical protein